MDGQFRDRVDDTQSTASWKATYDSLNRQWEGRLKEIENQVNDAITLFNRWGDKPYRWDRL